MSNISIEDIHLIGLPLKHKTSNTGGQSSIDCENLWHEFDKAKYADIIPNKLSEELYGVYYKYEGDSTKPFSYFIGCKVEAGTEVPAGLERLTIPKGIYHKLNAKGKMPDCVTAAWKDVWTSTIPRTHTIDFEVYDERSKNWEDAEVDVYLSVKQ